jgi:UDP-N-acetylmuramate--alanine ligase
MGIGGSGVSALAAVFVARGDSVSGCDLRESESTRRLREQGVSVAVGHNPDHVRGQDMIVHSGAVKDAGQAELDAARAAGVATLSRAETLAQLITESRSIAVTGTHGKTTVTFMLGHILTQAGWDPTVLVADGLNARAGHGRWLVAEADESDGSLELHHPTHALLTGVELDHPDHFRDLGAVRDLFALFLRKLPGDGLAVVCEDDPIASALPTTGRRVGYGYAASEFRCTDDRPFRLWHGDRELGPVPLRVPGRHNVQNACGAAAMAISLGVEFEVVATALGTFHGAHRRLEYVGAWRDAYIYTDYGHHPTEVAATLQAAREIPFVERLVLIFQPHRYSRFSALRDQFAGCFGGADLVIITEIYGAGEENPGGVSARDLAERVPGATFATGGAELRRLLEETALPNDLLLFMGAGDIWEVARELAHQA